LDALVDIVTVDVVVAFDAVQNGNSADHHTVRKKEDETSSGVVCGHSAKT